MISLRICNCCCDETYKLVQRLYKDQEFFNTMNTELDYLPTSIKNGLINMLTHSPVELNQDGENLLMSCIYYLISLNLEPKNHEKGYKTIWSFIYDCLGIRQNSGYDYLLMCYLETHYYMEHGSGIRRGWIMSDRTDKDYIHTRIDDILQGKNTADYTRFHKEVIEPWLLVHTSSDAPRYDLDSAKFNELYKMFVNTVET